MRFCEDHFAKQYKQTIGVDFFIQRLEMPNNISVTLQVWDIGGQSIFGKMIQTYIYEANAVVLVYDITNQQSFQDLEDWLALVKKTFQGKDEPLLILMGNKIDLNHMQAVKTDQHEKFADSENLYSFYVSAKTGDQVSACFYKIAADLAGIEISKPQIEVTQKQVVAEIIQHKQNEETQPRAEQKLANNPNAKSKLCSIF